MNSEFVFVLIGVRVLFWIMDSLVNVCVYVKKNGL